MRCVSSALPALVRLHRFHGGLALPGHKAESAGSAIRPCPLPDELVVPLLQHAGQPAAPCVQPGDRVLRGQRIGIAQGRGADVHAASSGRVVAVQSGPLPHRPGVDAAQACADHVLIACDGEDRWSRLPSLDPATCDPATLHRRVREAGIVGLGGAGFPTADKLDVERRLLVLNGAECEPWIACDDRLLRERADEVVLGGAVLARISGARRNVLAVEDGMPEALAAAQAAADALPRDWPRIEVVAVPTVYPAGGERQLLRVLTGAEVPRGGLPRELGAIVHNVGTAAATARAVLHGEALTSRIVSVTGRGVRAPGNFEVRIGTPVASLVAAAGGYTAGAARLVVGGSMMGQALPHDGHAVGKLSNCVLVLVEDDVHDPHPVLPCIRCGACADACPARLLPQQLHWFVQAARWDRAGDHGLLDCIECGCCDLVCPSHLPLVEWFRHGKTELAVRAHEEACADAARLRHEARALRLERQEAERAARRARAAAPEAVQAALQRMGGDAPAAISPDPGPDGAPR